MTLCVSSFGVVCSTAPDDYTSLSTTLTFAPGVSLVPVRVQTSPDDALEGDEQFEGVLSRLDNSDRVTITVPTAVATIIDDDG